VALPESPQEIPARRKPAPAALYFAVLDRSCQAVCYRNVIGSRLGDVETPDSVAEVADFLLAHERMGWSVVTGRHDGELYISLRAIRGRGAGHLLREVLRERGTAGGHGRMAGGQVDISGLTAFEVEALEEELLGRTLALSATTAGPSSGRCSAVPSTASRERTPLPCCRALV
jgi:hypothetical protein